jgi:hypothetical protein
MVQNILIDIWITSQAGVWGVCPPTNRKNSFIYITPSILVKISFILHPISITPIVYKNQVSGYGFWTKFFMVFSYTVFL